MDISDCSAEEWACDEEETELDIELCAVCWELVASSDFCVACCANLDADSAQPAACVQSVCAASEAAEATFDSVMEESTELDA